MNASVLRPLKPCRSLKHRDTCNWAPQSDVDEFYFTLLFYLFTSCIREIIKRIIFGRDIARNRWQPINTMVEGLESVTFRLEGLGQLPHVLFERLS